MLLETLADVCVACAGDGSPVPANLLGAGGAPSTGPAPSGPDHRNGPDNGPDDGPDNEPDNGPSDNGPDNDPDNPSQDPPERSWWDNLFDSDPDVEDAAESIIQDVATETALDVAGSKMPWSAGAAGTLGTVVSGSEVLAKGVGTIAKNKGRGMGGSSKGGQKIWEALERERSYQQPPEDD